MEQIKRINDFRTISDFIIRNSPFGIVLNLFFWWYIELCLLVSFKLDVCYGYYLDDKLAAVLIMNPKKKVLKYISVDKQYRNRGIAKELFKFSQCTKGFPLPNTKRYWEKLGFKKVRFFGMYVKNAQKTKKIS